MDEETKALEESKIQFDLTPLRHFSSTNSSTSSNGNTRRIIPSIISVDFDNIKFPWEQRADSLYDKSFEFEFLHTGTSEEIRAKIEMEIYTGGEHCDRCGALISLDLPWNRCGTLCNRCNAELEEELGQYKTSQIIGRIFA